jgi:GNAT superfamily N-acetyltransferase
MNAVTIEPLTRAHGKTFLTLIDALADYEKLKKPTRAARTRLLRDGLGKQRRFDAYLAFIGKRAVGYAIIFETYSSFLALPTLYLEDIFILPKFRSLGIGKKLFLHCVQEARRRKCGRMEWVVLDWNANAIRFYKNLDAQHLKKWHTYRLEQKQFRQLLRKW